VSHIKNNLAKNIAELRKHAGMTQIDLAEKLNYSDKAVSKWERGESVPELATLLELSELFGVSLDTLVCADDPFQTEADAVPRRVRKWRKHAVITILGVVLVWFVALLSFVLISHFAPSVKGEWLLFVAAVPAGSIVWLVLNSIWLNRRLNYLIISVLTWSALATLHLSLLIYVGNNLWMLYLLGIPAQVGIVVWSCMHAKSRNVEK